MHISIDFLTCPGDLRSPPASSTARLFSGRSSGFDCSERVRFEGSKRGHHVSGSLVLWGEYRRFIHQLF